jgi:hypothetical protein
MDVNDHALSQQGEEQSIKSPQGNDEAVRPANENCTVEWYVFYDPNGGQHKKSYDSKSM